MEFFLYLLGDDKNFINSEFRLGEKSFSVFWADEGMKTLIKLLKSHPEKADEIQIVNNQGKKYSIEEFLTFIEKLQVRMN